MAYTFSAPPIGGSLGANGVIGAGSIVADVSAALRVTDTNDNDRIAKAADSASRRIETYCHTRFWQDPSPRTDTGCTVTLNSATVLDPSCNAADFGRIVTDADGYIPTSTPPTIVASVNPGVSFTMSNLRGDPVTATGGATEAVTLGLWPRMYVCEDQQLVEVDGFFTRSGLTVQTDYAGNGSYGVVWTPDDYQLEPLNGLNAGQPWPYSKIRAVRSLYFPLWGGIAFPKPKTQALVLVAAQWGWPTSSFADVYEAAIIETIKVFKSEDVPFGATPAGEAGVLRIRPDLHPEAASLLEPYAGDPDELYVG